MVGFELSKAVNANNVFLVKHSELEGRLDSYFYKPDFYELDKKLIKNNNVRFCHLIKSILNGYDFRDYKEFGTPYIKVANVKQGEFDFRKIQYIDFDSDEISKSIQLKKGNLLLTRKGTFGNALSLEKNYDFVISSEVFYIELTEQINSKYLEIFFNSALGQKQFDRNKIGAIMGSLSQEAVKSIKIPLPTLDFQENIVETHQAAYLKKQQKEVEAQALLDGIDGYLLNELGITLPQQDNRLEKRIFTVPFSEVVGKRVDPDYRLKYELLFSQNGKYEFVKLKELLIDTPQYGANEEGRERNSDEDVRYIRITDIDELGNLKNNDWKTAQNIEEQYLLKKDDILFARSGSVGRCYIHKETEQSAIFAGYLIRFKLNEQKLNSNFMFYYCNSKFYKFWVTAIERPAVQSNINAEEYKALPIPLPPIEKQNEIAAHISQIRAQAKQLQADAAQVLANAKAEIERMILGENS